MENIKGERTFEDLVRHRILPFKGLGVFNSGDSTPSVENLETWVANNTIIGTIIINFLNGSAEQRLKILGDGFTQVANNANIKTNTGANKLLVANVVYKFTYINNVWYEDVDTTGGAIGPQGVPGPQGLAGLQNVTLDGKPGKDGFPGPQGIQGIRGKDGQQIFVKDGKDGKDGLSIPGQQGIQGNTGPVGKDGLTIPGLDGKQGKDGLTIPGPQGLQGPQGIQGLQGKDGIQGTIGMDGKQGSWGFPGSPGKDGITKTMLLTRG